MFKSDFWHNHPEFHQRSTAGKPLTRLSYAFPEVREFKLEFVREAVKRVIDGVNLDFQRHPEFFDHEEPMLREFRKKYDDNPLKIRMDDPLWDSIKAKIMNQYIGDAGWYDYDIFESLVSQREVFLRLPDRRQPRMF